MNSFIWITAQKAMVHCYPNPPAVVGFLQNTHRHLFKIKVWIEVFHNNRDLEFFIFQAFVEDCLSTYASLHSKTPIGVHEWPISFSCEDLSDYIYREIIIKYPGRQIKIEISEDGENGSYKEY